MLGNFNSDYWNWLETVIFNCNPDRSEHWRNRQWSRNYNIVINSTYGCIYAALTALVLAVAYYILRPAKDEMFRKWWVRGGQYPVFLIFAGSITTIVMVIIMVGNFGLYANSDSHVCRIWSTDGPSQHQLATGFGVATLLVCLLSSLYMMLRC